jgi:hypothetical protein
MLALMRAANEIPNAQTWVLAVRVVCTTAS